MNIDFELFEGCDMAVYVFLNDTYSDWELGYILPSLVMQSVNPKIVKRNRKVGPPLEKWTLS
jgi:hypothetical protein